MSCFVIVHDGTQVSHETGKSMKMVVPARGIWGTAGIDGLNIDRAIASKKGMGQRVLGHVAPQLAALRDLHH